MDAADKIAEIRQQYLEQWESSFDADYETLEGASESPIEQIMGAALVAAFRSPWCPLPYFTFWDRETPNEPFDVDVVVSQAKIAGGKYRADFIIICSHKEPGKHPIAVVVECDGHEYHERTKEQAARDRQRDRFVQAAGGFILRFTGAEIWKDALGCASQVATFLQNKRFE